MPRQVLVYKTRKRRRDLSWLLTDSWGWVELDETPEQAIKREVFEEVGIDLKTVTPFDFDSQVTIYKGEKTQLIALRYTAEVNSFHAKVGDDAKEVYWLAKDELLKYKQNPLTERFLRKLGLISEKGGHYEYQKTN